LITMLWQTFIQLMELIFSQLTELILGDSNLKERRIKPIRNCIGFFIIFTF
jgi:hypothetical protein